MINGRLFNDRNYPISHDWLMYSLAHAKETEFTNITLGSFWAYVLDRRIEKQKQGRADVVKVMPSFTKSCIDIYEIKHNRADLLSDLRSEKWKKYLPHCNRLYFACLIGISTKYEIPDEVGLIVYSPDKKTWTTIKAAKRRDIEYDIEFLWSLIIARQRKDNRRKFADYSDYYQIAVSQKKKHYNNIALKSSLKKKGDMIAKMARAVNDYRYKNNDFNEFLKQKGI